MQLIAHETVLHHIVHQKILLLAIVWLLLVGPRKKIFKITTILHHVMNLLMVTLYCILLNYISWSFVHIFPILVMFPLPLSYMYHCCSCHFALHVAICSMFALTSNIVLCSTM